MHSSASEPQTGLSIQEILETLPHRYPMLMVDRILRLEPGTFAEGIKCVTMNEPFFQGHFPGHPIMPGVLIVESMAQVAGIMLRVQAMSQSEAPSETQGLRPSRPGVMASIQRMRFRHPVVPGDQLRVRATHLKSLGSIHQVKVEALVKDTLVADGELMLGS